MSDDPGLLGNLPRSRPGTRSDKRASGVAAKPGSAKAKPSAAKAKPSAAKAKPRPKAKARSAAKPRPQAKARLKVANPKPRPAPERQAGDPVSEVLKAAGRLAGAGARTANGVTREILRRLPRR